MYDIIIIGGGAAGSTAAFFAARNRFKTLLLDKGSEFSSLGLTSSVTDMPGIDKTVSGIEALARIKKQAEDLSAEIRAATVTACMVNNGTKRVVTNEPINYDAKVVILATGNVPQHDSHVYQGEPELRGRGVSHDVDADASICKQTQVAVIGKSTTSAEAVLKLADYAEKVYWVIPASKIDLIAELREKIEANKKVEVFFSSSLKRINGTSEVNSITLLTMGQEKTLSVRYVFLPPLQYKPATDYLNGTGIQTSQEGLLLVSQQFETSISGIFAAGNILCMKPQLNIVCAAQGAIAALNAEKYLRL